jgi:hypothetical protein
LTLEEKIIRAKSDLDDVYAAGVKKGRDDGGYNEGFEAGKKSEYDEFWDNAFLHYTHVARFAGPAWNNKTFKPNKSFTISGNANMVFYNNCYEGSLTELAQSLGIEIIIKATSLQQGFTFSKITECKVDCSLMSDLGSTFASASKLVTIELTGVLESLNFSGTFSGCSSLVNFIVSGVIGTNALNLSSCKDLTHDSLMYVLNALRDNSGTTTWNSITLGADNIAKLTAEELEIMDNKQWSYS